MKTEEPKKKKKVYKRKDTSLPRPPFLTGEQVAEILNCSYKTLRRMDADGRLKPAFALSPNAVRYDLGDIEAFIQNAKGSLPLDPQQIQKRADQAAALALVGTEHQLPLSQ
jgi:hypothetical protein